MLKKRLRATLIRGSESHPAVTETLSLREMTLQSTWHVPPGSRLIVELGMPDGTSLRFAALARRSHDPGALLAGHVAGEVTLELVGTVAGAYEALVEPAAPAPARPPTASKGEAPRGVAHDPATIRGPRSASDLRRHPRYPVYLQARYEFFVGSFADLAHESATEVIGRGGCMLVTGARTETVSRRLRVHLALPSGESVAIAGAVAWVNPARLGTGGVIERAGTMGVSFDPSEEVPKAFLELLDRCEAEAQAIGAAPPRVSETTEIPVKRTTPGIAEPARPREVALTRAEAYRRKAAAEAAARSATPPSAPEAPAPVAQPVRTPPPPGKPAAPRAAPVDVEAMLREYATTVPEPAQTPPPPTVPAPQLEAMLREYAAEPDPALPAPGPAPEQKAIDSLLRDFLGKSASGR